MKKNKINYQTVIVEQLKKEAAVHALFRKLKIKLDDDSPLDISNITEVLLLMGLPFEKDLPEGRNWDSFIDDYTAVIWGDKTALEVVLSWEKKLKSWKVTPYSYNAKLHQTVIVEHIEKQQVLLKAIKALGSENSTQHPLAKMVENFNFLNALMGPDLSSERSEELFSVVEKNGNLQSFVHKWL